MLANPFNITANNVLNVQNMNDPQQQRQDQKSFVDLLNNNQTMTKQQYGFILRQQIEYNKQNKSGLKERTIENKIGQNINQNNNNNIQPNIQQEINYYKNDVNIQEEKFNSPEKSFKNVRGAFFRIHQDQNQLEEKRKKSEQWSRELQQQIEEKNQRKKIFKQDQNLKDLQYEQQINQDRNILKEKNKEILKEEQNHLQKDAQKQTYQNLEKINQQTQKNQEFNQILDQDENNSYSKLSKNDYTWRPTGQWQPGLIDVSSLKQIQNERQNKLVQEVNNLKLDLEIASQNRNDALLDMLMLRNKTRVSNLNDIMIEGGDIKIEQQNYYNDYLNYEIQQEPNINYNFQESQVLDSKSLFVHVDYLDQQNKNDHGQSQSVQSFNKSKILSEFDYREDMIVPEAENEESVKEEEEEQNNSFLNKNQYNDDEYQENIENQIQDKEINDIRNIIYHTIEEKDTEYPQGFYDGQIQNMIGDIDGILERLETNINKTKGFSYIPKYESNNQINNAQIQANEYINKYVSQNKEIQTKNKPIQNSDALFDESCKNIENFLKDLQK